MDTAVHHFAFKLASVLRLAADEITAWRERSRLRRELRLLTMSDADDLGLDMSDIWREARKPFWRR